MSGLKERTRRFWVSTLFLLLGPSTLALTCLALFWQKTPDAAKILNARSASRTSFDIKIGAYKHARPNVELLTRVSLSKKEAKQASFFCPEVYRIRQTDSSIFESFVQSFETKTERVESASAENVGAEFYESQEQEPEESVNVAQNETSRRYAEDARALAKSCELFVVPRVYCRESKLAELKDEIATLTNAFDVRENRAFCLVVQELVCQSDDEFEKTTLLSDSLKRPLRTNELRSIFRTAALLKPKGEAIDRGKTLAQEVLVFSSELPKLENLRALFVQTENYSRVEALFELQKITCPAPYRLAWTRQDDGTSRVEYDSLETPTPVSFLAKFLPGLRRLGDESYFFGKLSASTDARFQAELFNSTLNVVSAASQNADANSRVWTTKFEDFRLCNLQIDDLCAELALPGFFGRLTQLKLDKGAIRQGVFLGSGSVALKDCGVPTKIIQDLLAKETLSVVPRSAASLRFANDSTPFSEFAICFKLLPSGVVLDSTYENKIIGCYQHEKVKYGLFLSKSQAGAPIPYSEPISALVETQNVDTFWTPLVRDALNHLPISDATLRNADASNSLLR